MAGVKKVDNIKPEVALKPEDVVVGAMKDFGDCWVGEGGEKEWHELAALNGVDDEVLRSS